MKNIFKICIVLSFIFATLCGCEKEKNVSDDISTEINTKAQINESNQQNSNKSPIGLTISQNSDINKLADSLKELYNDSDIVCQIKVTDVNPYIDEMARIWTEVTPEVICIYKGNYNNEKINILGGRMPYSEFISNETVKKKFEGKMHNEETSNELLNTDVEYIADNGYIYNIDDEYIFFGNYDDTKNNFITTYCYQGSFKIENGKVSNKALTSGENLKKDLLEKFNENNLKSKGLENELLEIEVDNFSNILKNLNNKVAN